MKPVLVAFLMLLLPGAAAKNRPQKFSCNYERQEYPGGNGWIMITLSEPCNDGRQEDTWFKHPHEPQSSLMQHLLQTGNYENIIIAGNSITLQHKRNVDESKAHATFLTILEQYFQTRDAVKCSEKVRKKPPPLLMRRPSD